MSAFWNPTLVDVAIDKMLELDHHFELNLWPTDSIADRRHDIGVMVAHGAIVSLTTELLCAENVVVFAYSIPFEGTDNPRVDGEVHWPLIDRARVVGGRLLVRRHGNKEAAYRDQLRLPWSPAASLQHQAGDTCAAGASGGSFHLGQAHRRRLIVTQAGPRFAFADFADEGACRAHVFLLQK